MEGGTPDDIDIIDAFNAFWQTSGGAQRLKQNIDSESPSRAMDGCAVADFYQEKLNVEKFEDWKRLRRKLGMWTTNCTSRILLSEVMHMWYYDLWYATCD